MNATAGTKPEDYTRHGRKSESRPGSWGPAARCKDMDIDGVDAAAIYDGGPLASRDIELHLESFDAYNRLARGFLQGSTSSSVGYRLQRSGV